MFPIKKIFRSTVRSLSGKNTQKGKIFFISGPSGVGKGTLINLLKERHPDWIFPPSCTTRESRPGEVDGETYYFITKEAFQTKIEAGDFLEWAVVHGGNFYGTLKNLLLDPVKQGKIVIREFDVQGFESAKKVLPQESYHSIFLEPADRIEDLVARIRERAPISDEEVEKRTVSMQKELEKKSIYDSVVLSEGGDIEGLYEAAMKVITSHV